MSKINAIRFVNINYNNNMNKISDECMYLNGDNTLITMDNGVGKTVMVQLITALFVQKRYRQVKNRPFESYFTTNKPSFIMVEWALDGQAGYVLTGMMVRQSQHTEAEEDTALDIVNFVAEYKAQCPFDIHHLQVVNRTDKELILNSYSNCKKLFEDLRRENKGRFAYYDMNNYAQSKQYFQNLREHGIEYREWQSIIREVNKDESGLSQYFDGCSNEKELIEKKFLPIIEEKLNNEGDKIQEFREITGKYIHSYYNNNEKIRHKENILYLQQQAQAVEKAALTMSEAEEAEAEQLAVLQGAYGKMESLRNEMQTEIQQVQEDIDTLQENILQLDKERISAEYYALQDKLSTCQKLMGEYKEQLDEIDEEIASWKQRQHIQECAYEQNQIDKVLGQIIELEAQREVLSRQELDNKPEIDYLGYCLKKQYSQLLKKLEDDSAERQQEAEQLQAEIRRLKHICQATQLELDKLHKLSGELKARKNTYDKEEQQYNQRYATRLQRNLMGLYDDGMLDILGEELADKLTSLTKNIADNSEAIAKTEEAAQNYEREIQSIQTKQMQNHRDIDHGEMQLQELNKQLAQRQDMLKYADLPEKEIYNGQLIQTKLVEKVQRLQGDIRRGEMAQEALRKELHVLETGRSVELGDELLDMFRELDITIVQGMEWLKQNGNTQQQNTQLVKKLPFLPYALLMSRHEFQRLQKAKANGGACTSFPIPIVLREELAGEPEHYDWEKLPFYMLFNEELLDDAKLKDMQVSLKQKLSRKEEEIDHRRQEQDKYAGLLGVLNNQTVTKAIMDKAKEELGEFSLVKEALANQLTESKHNQIENKKLYLKLQEQQNKNQKQLETMSRQQDDLALLVGSYRDYQEALQAIEANGQAILAQEKKIQQGQDKINGCEEKAKWITQKIIELNQQVDEHNKKAANFQSYGSCERPEAMKGLPEDIEHFTARYEVLTKGCRGEMENIVSQLEKAQSSVSQMENHMKVIAKEYNLAKEDWQNVVYSEIELLEAKDKLKQLCQDREVKQQKYYQEDKNSVKVQQQMENTLQTLQRECNTREPLSRESIKSKEYAYERNLLLNRKEKSTTDLHNHQQRLAIYEGGLDVMANYRAENAIWDTMEWPDFASMSREKLRAYLRELQVRYDGQQKIVQDCLDNMRKQIQKLLRDERLSEGFFQKQLLTLEGVSMTGHAVQSQLERILKAYELTLQKLELDLARVEAEQKNLENLLLDYVKNVHEELGKMDRNSSINIRGKSIKMLRIDLMDWEQELEYYKGLMEAYLGELTKSGLEILEQQQSLKELLGQGVTTKNLYDQIVGLQNISIHLYKIEHDREIRISWRDVAKNSGGEGFLSAFVILSSLLYYMRRDETDIFADRNEGKVLLMDNPFAKTYSAHLLKPLMEVARKNNTQLICLTGLGGDNIYNRFDNIYMLKLVNRSLSNVRYLSSQHVNGPEPRIIEMDHLQVADEESEIWLF